MLWLWHFTSQKGTTTNINFSKCEINRNFFAISPKNRKKFNFQGSSLAKTDSIQCNFALLNYKFPSAILPGSERTLHVEKNWFYYGKKMHLHPTKRLLITNSLHVQNQTQQALFLYFLWLMHNFFISTPFCVYYLLLLCKKSAMYFCRKFLRIWSWFCGVKRIKVRS